MILLRYFSAMSRIYILSGESMSLPNLSKMPSNPIFAMSNPTMSRQILPAGKAALRRITEMSFLSHKQEAALNSVAEAFGWDKMPIDEFFLIVWSAFHYYVKRLGRENHR
jgi:hypothetical protein